MVCSGCGFTSELHLFCFNFSSVGQRVYRLNSLKAESLQNIHLERNSLALPLLPGSVRTDDLLQWPHYKAHQDLSHKKGCPTSPTVRETLIKITLVLFLSLTSEKLERFDSILSWQGFEKTACRSENW